MVDVAISLRPRSIAAASAGNAVVLVAQTLARLGAVVILAAVLGPSGQGQVTRVTLIATLGAGILALGTDVAVTRSAAIPELREDAHRTVSTQIVLAVVLVGLGVGVVAAVFGTDSQTRLLILGLLSTLPLLFSRLLAATALGESAHRRYATASIAPFALFLTAVAALALLQKLNVTSAILALLSAYGFAAIVLIRGARPFLSKLGLPWRLTTYGTAIRVFPGFVTQLTSLRLDQVVIALVLAPAELGLYAVAVSVTELAWLPAQSVANVVLPRAAVSGGVPRKHLRWSCCAASAAVLFVLPVFLLAVHLLPEYSGAAVAFVLLVPGAAAAATNKVLAAHLTAIGRGWHVSKIGIAGAAVAVMLDVALIPSAGIAGAAVASTVAYSVCCVLLILDARRRTIE